MFTVCPKCMLTLAVTAHDLRMGQGYVRCGRCANVFNALLTLSEEPAEEISSSAPPPTPADRASTSQIAAALRQDASSTAPPAAEAASGPLTHLPTEQSSDGSIENESNFAAGTGTFETIVLEGEAISQTEEYVPEESVDSELAALTHRLEVASHEPLAHPPERQAEAPASDTAANDADADNLIAEDVLAEDEITEDAVAEDAIADDVIEDYVVGDYVVSEEAAAEAIDADGFEPSPPPPSRARWAWIGGSIALLLLLALQAVHHWRNALAASPAWNVVLTPTYAALGMPLEPHWDLSAYDVRQQGASADPVDPEVIRVRLSLANHAARAQPLPLLRLTLLDRYGKRVAASELAPSQYWPPGVPARTFIGRDERIDTEVAVRDPSAASASFELDVCLRSSTGTVRCAADTASERKLADGMMP
jgi:predicted Zn finger-like uncharacterized protein